MKRRQFLTGLLATPMVVRAGSLDYVPRGRLLVPMRPSGVIPRASLVEHMWPAIMEWFGPDSREGFEEWRIT